MPLRDVIWRWKELGWLRHEKVFGCGRKVKNLRPGNLLLAVTPKRGFREKRARKKGYRSNKKKNKKIKIGIDREVY
jgi:hypothetical protein